MCLIDSKFNFSNPEFREYCKKKVIEKYGIDNVFKLPKIKEKIKQTNLERYGNVIPVYLNKVSSFEHFDELNKNDSFGLIIWL